MQTQDEKEKERLKKREERCERILNPKTTYEDVEYTASLQGNAQKIEDALKAAKKTCVGTKRKTTLKKSDKNKKSRMWTGIDDSTDSSDESSADEETDSTINKSSPVVEKVNGITEKSIAETTASTNESILANNKGKEGVAADDTIVKAVTEEDRDSKTNDDVHKEDALPTDTSNNQQKVFMIFTFYCIDSCITSKFAISKLFAERFHEIPEL